jgi:hypothetical protein
VLCCEADERAEPFAVRRVGRRWALVVVLLPQHVCCLKHLRRGAATAVSLHHGRSQSGRGRAPVSHEAKQRRAELLVAIAQSKNPRVMWVLVCMNLNSQDDAKVLGQWQEPLHRVGRERDLDPCKWKAKARRGGDLTFHVGNQLVVGEQPVAANAHVRVHGARCQHESGLIDQAAEPVDELVPEDGEATEAGEPDDLQTGSHPVGDDLADELIQVVATAVKRPREAVEGDALDRASQRCRITCRCGHRATPTIRAVEDSSIRRTP